MPIHVVCEGCEAEFDFPETLAGKTIKCKSCGEGIPVVAKKSAPTKPKMAKPTTKMPAMVDDDLRPAKPAKRNFGVDDDDDDQPRSKSSKAAPAKKKSALPLILAGVLGLVVIGGGAGVYLSGMLDSKPEVAVNTLPQSMGDPRNQPNMNAGKDTTPGEETDVPEKKPTKTDDTKAGKTAPPKTDKTDTTPADNGSADDKPKAIIPVPIETKKPPMPATASTNPGVPRSTPDQFALTRAKNAAVFIECETNNTLGTGTGWFGMEANLIFTNAHVLDMLAPNAPKPKKLSVYVNPGTNQERIIPHSRLEILAVDRYADLAMIRVLNEKDLPTPLKIRSSLDLRDVEPLVVIGYPAGRLLSQIGARSNRAPQATVNTTSFSTNRIDDDGNLYSVQIRGGAARGNSGGPIIDYDGNVVAVLVRGPSDPNLFASIQYGVPTEFVTGLMAGRISDIEYGQAYRKNGQIHIPVNLTILDPFQRMKEVGIGFWVGDASTKTRPSGKDRTGVEQSDSEFKTVKFDYKWTKEKQTATGEIVFPELQSGRAYYAQPYLSNSLLEKYWMAGKVIKLNGPPVDLEDVTLQVRYKTGSRRPITISTIINYEEFEIGEGNDFDDRTLIESELKGLETVEKSNDSNAVAVLRINYDKMSLKAQRGQQKTDIIKLLIPPQILQALNSSLKLVQGFGFVNSKGEIFKTLSDLRGAPQFADFFKEISTEALESLQSTSVRLPNGVIKPGQTWTVDKNVRFQIGFTVSAPPAKGNNPPPSDNNSKALQPPRQGGAPRQTTRVNEYKYLEAITYTYLGTRTRIGQKEAVIRVEGVIKPQVGSSAGATGTVKGYAYIDLDTGTLLETELKKEFEMDTSRDGVKMIVSGIDNFKVTRGSAQ